MLEIYEQRGQIIVLLVGNIQIIVLLPTCEGSYQEVGAGCVFLALQSSIAPPF